MFNAAKVNTAQSMVKMVSRIRLLFNAVDIIKSRTILSRHKTEGQFSNSAGNLVARRDTAHDFARFYYRPQTPTQFYNECLGMDSNSGYWGWRFGGYDYNGKKIWSEEWKSYYPKARNLGLPKCPMPVFFKFDLKEVLRKMPLKCFYSTGNMQTNWARVEKISENPNSLNTQYLYSTVTDYENYKQYSQQEFLVEEEFDFSNLDSFEVICYDKEHASILKSQLGNDPICKKITSNSWDNRTGCDIFHRNNRRLKIRESEMEVLIYSEYRDNAYLSVKGDGLQNIQILNPSSIQKETTAEILAYPEIQFAKTEQSIEVYFVDLAIGKREWLVYSNKSVLPIAQQEQIDKFKIPNEVIVCFGNLSNQLKLNLSKDLFYPHMVNSYHGISHTMRVLFGTCLLLHYTDDIPDDTKEAILYSAIIHDLGKTSDKEGSIHGENSAKLYMTKIQQYISNENLQNSVLEAVKYHSVDDKDCPKEMQNDVIWKVLKDADALDRGRFNRKCDKSYLRLDIFKTELGNHIIGFMEKLAFHTQNLKWNNPYRELIDCIKQII